MSKKYIEREALLERLSYNGSMNLPPKEYYYETILNFPAADVAPIVHGEWREEFRSQKSPDGYFYWNTPQKKIYVCSICGREEIKKEPYCNCGAKMDGGNINE